MSKTYKDDGVDIAEGDSFSGFAGCICRDSYNNSPFVLIHDYSSGHFRGPRAFSLRGLPVGYTMDAAPDGIGTKVVIITAASSHHEAARDLLAMTCGDITRFGGLPLVFINILDVASLTGPSNNTNSLFRKMIEGLGVAAKEQGLVILRGETAELGDCVGSEWVIAPTKFNWGGMTIGVYHPDKMITGESLAVGQVIVALKEEGFRSNGISSVRAAFRQRFMQNWYQNPEAEEAITAASHPSILYDRLLSEANGWYSPDFSPKVKMHSIVHLTGGSIKSKLGEDILFPIGLSADLHNLFIPPQIMRDCAEWREMEDYDTYSVWNGGQGALVVVDAADADTLINLANSHGIQAQYCGVIKKDSSPQIVIQSKFHDKEVIYRG